MLLNLQLWILGLKRTDREADLTPPRVKNASYLLTSRCSSEEPPNATRCKQSIHSLSKTNTHCRPPAMSSVPTPTISLSLSLSLLTFTPVLLVVLVCLSPPRQITLKEGSDAPVGEEQWTWSNQACDPRAYQNVFEG